MQANDIIKLTVAGTLCVTLFFATLIFTSFYTARSIVDVNKPKSTLEVLEARYRSCVNNSSAQQTHQCDSLKNQMNEERDRKAGDE